MKSNNYWKEISPFKEQLAGALSNDELRALHVRRPSAHLRVAARQFGIVAVCGWALWHFSNPLIWVPVAVIQGFTFFNMTTLLHEVVHNSVFRSTQHRWERVLGLAYAITSGISASQFTRWHLDHHDNLGNDHDDPKRHWLSPKRNARWYKLLYCTPWLMPKYFQAAARESASYPAALRRTIMIERFVTIGIQLSVMAALYYFGGFARMARVQLVPYFLVFPVAFTLNRLGQHYNIDPSHPLKWATLMKPSRFWDFLFLYSNYHLEHHYFPRVPFYNLRKLHMKLRPLYAQLGLKPHTYREIVWQWFVLNRAPHTNWEIPAAPTGPGAPGGSSHDEDATDDSPHPSGHAATPPAEQVAARIAVR